MALGGDSKSNPISEDHPAAEGAPESKADTEVVAKSDLSDAKTKPEKPDVPAPSFGGLLQKLKDYKELIVIVLFAIGGATWLYAAFATKEYVAQVRCLLGATVERIDNEAQSRSLSDAIIDANVRLSELTITVVGVPPPIQKIETLRVEISDLIDKKALADKVTKEASRRVQNGECE